MTTLRPCSQCDAPISRDATICPQCGGKQPRRTKPITWAIAAAVALIVLASIWPTAEREAAQNRANDQASARATFEANLRTEMEQAKATRIAAFDKDRARVLPQLKRLNDTGKPDEAKALAAKYDGASDPDLQREAERAEKLIDARLTAKAKALAKTRGVSVGMTKQEVLGSSWGKPEHVNKTVGAAGTREQWVYPGQQYLYFEGDRLTTIQTH